jgi:hypothetical protein
MTRRERSNLVRQIASYAFEEEYEAVMDKIHTYEQQLAKMSDAEFNKAIIEYADKLIKEAMNADGSR